MRFSVLSGLGLLTASVLASPLDNYAMHEKRGTIPQGWSKRGQLDRRSIVPMRIALAQRNMERGYEFLEEVSHPESSKYGQHWSSKEVADMFRPRYVSNGLA